MGVVFCGEWADRLLEDRAVSQPWGLERSSLRTLDGAECSVRALHELDAALTDAEVLVGNAALRTGREPHHIRVYGGTLPPGSFISLEEGCYLVSPELMLLLEATRLSAVEWIQLACRYCGTYSLAPWTRTGIIEREPLTTVARLERFFDEARGTYGAKRARAQLKWVVEMSNSPMETNLAMQFYLPCRMGGFGLPTPRMNEEVILDAKASELADGRRTCRIDLYWEVGNKKLGLEYYGRATHEGEALEGRDISRENALDYLGIPVKPVSWEQLRSPDHLELMARWVSNVTGKRVRLERVPLERRTTLLTSTLARGCWVNDRVSPN